MELQNPSLVVLRGVIQSCPCSCLCEGTTGLHLAMPTAWHRTNCPSPVAAEHQEESSHPVGQGIQHTSPAPIAPNWPWATGAEQGWRGEQDVGS